MGKMQAFRNNLLAGICLAWSASAPLLSAAAAATAPATASPPSTAPAAVEGSNPSGKTARLDSLVKAKQAEKLERKLRTEYLKATRGIQCPTLKAEELLPILEDTNLVLLDIRQPEEQAVSMLPHAITPKDFAARFRKGIPKGKRIVVYCTIGYRSGKYAMELAGQGIRAENLEGGMLAWSHVGGPFEVRNDAGLATPTRRVHVFDKGWNFLHPDYEAVW
jgi:rhodanese-related sulfurtransferase